MKCNNYEQKITLQKQGNMPKDVPKLFAQIKKYREQNNIDSMIGFAKKVNEWLPIACMRLDKPEWSRWEAGTQNIPDSKYCCLVLFLKENLK